MTLRRQAQELISYDPTLPNFCTAIITRASLPSSYASYTRCDYRVAKREAIAISISCRIAMVGEHTKFKRERWLRCDITLMRDALKENLRILLLIVKSWEFNWDV